MFGEFRCPICNRYWCSGNSWANMGQKCLKCDIMVYPYEQVLDYIPLMCRCNTSFNSLKRPLQRREYDEELYDSGEPHLSHLCEKCKVLGHSCRGWRN